MTNALRDDDTFLLRPGWLRMILLSVILVFCACVFLFLAAIAVAIPVQSIVARIVLGFGALLLVALAVLMVLYLRTNIVLIEVGPDRLRLRMPRTRGPVPLLGAIRAELPYSAVAAVETREEAYRSFGLVTLQRAYSLVTRDGVRLPLGIMAENWGSQMPFDKAAARIAARAGVPITDHGTVRVGGVIHAVIHDVPPWSTAAMAVPESTAWHRRATLSMQIIMLLIVAVAILRACAGH